jgi:hypothetical protein
LQTDAQTSYPSFENGVVEGELLLGTFLSGTIGQYVNQTFDDELTRLTEKQARQALNRKEQRELDDVKDFIVTRDLFLRGRLRNQPLETRFINMKCMIGVYAVRTKSLYNAYVENGNRDIAIETARQHDIINSYYHTIDRIPVKNDITCRGLFGALRQSVQP